MTQTPDEKRCTKCLRALPVTAFTRDPQKKDGLRSSCKECRQGYYVDNRDARLAYGRRWYAENAVLSAALTRAWQGRNREQTQANSRRWKKENPDRVREYRAPRIAEENHRRRARVLGNGGSYTTDEWNALCAVFGDRCLACGSTGPLTVDHVIPLSLGGTNWIDNLQPLCMPCNQKKHRAIIDYRQDYCPCVA